MKTTMWCKIHNRFDIEVRDKETGELKQKGQAENIVLDRMYTRLCNFSTYFVNIFFGSGRGTLSPTRTTLFTSLGYKAAVTEETIKAFPISKWTRKITLAPEEYVNQTITEVGISETTTAINTHALITDSEGNPLSITKTDIDVVIIYATVFIEFQNKSDNIYFTNFPNNNELLNYLAGKAIDGSASPLYSGSERIYIGEFNNNIAGDVNMLAAQKIPTRVIDVPNRKISYNARFGVDEGNFNRRISEIALKKVFRCSLPEVSVFTEYPLNDINIGTGDGVKTIFELPNTDVFDVDIKIDGGIVDPSNYVLENIEYLKGNSKIPLYSIFADDQPLDLSLITSPFDNTVFFSNADDSTPLIIIIKVNPDKILNKWMTYSHTGLSNVNYSKSIEIYGSLNGISYTELSSSYVTLSTNTKLFQITQPYNYFKISMYVDITTSGQNVHYIYLQNDNRPRVVFTSPVPLNGIITADYKVPYIPKTEDYILDVSTEIVFGEGVS